MGTLRSIARWICAGVLAFGATGCGSRAPSAIPITVALEADHFVLANGLRVVLHRESRATTALVHVRYHVGSKDDPIGRSGFAHLFEHLMFRGARSREGKTFEGWLDAVGADVNAETSADTTDYHDAVPLAALPRALWLEADRMAYPLHDLDDEAFGAERDVVKNEHRERHDSVPYGNVEIVAREAVFGEAHPYGAPVIGSERDLDAITLAEARTFGRTYYAPNNATLVVCSPLALPAVRQMVMKWFATIPPGPSVSTVGVAPVRLRRAKTITLDADVDGPAVAFAWPAPAVHGDGLMELHYALRDFAALAYRRLVIEEKMATDVDVEIEEGMLGSMVLAVAKLRRNETVEAGVAALDGALQATPTSVLRSESFGDRRTRALLHQLRSVETLQGRAHRLLHDVEYHGATDAMQGDLKLWQAVTKDDVAGAAEQFLLDRPRVTVLVRRRAGAPTAGVRVK